MIDSPSEPKVPARPGACSGIDWGSSYRKQSFENQGIMRICLEKLSHVKGG
jgi:hypothetical protein